MNLAGIVGILTLCALSAVLGALGWERYQLREANTEWSQTVEKVRKTNAEALAAERRLSAARSTRAASAAKLEAAVDANADDCPTSDAEQQLLNLEAEQTRANRPANLPAG